MERNYGQEIDALRGELVELRRLLMDQQMCIRDRYCTGNASPGRVNLPDERGNAFPSSYDEKDGILFVPQRFFAVPGDLRAKPRGRAADDHRKNVWAVDDHRRLRMGCGRPPPIADGLWMTCLLYTSMSGASIPDCAAGCKSGAQRPRSSV